MTMTYWDSNNIIVASSTKDHKITFVVLFNFHDRSVCHKLVTLSVLFSGHMNVCCSMYVRAFESHNAI